MKKIYLEEGKYIFYKDNKGIIHCDRYGEEWRDFIGDKAVSALFDFTYDLLQFKK